MQRNFMRDFNQPMAERQRRLYVYFRDVAGVLHWRLRRWYDEKVFHVIAVAVLLLVASSWQYQDEVAEHKQKRAVAEREAKVAAAMYRAEGFIYMIEARNLQEFDSKVRRLRDEMSDALIHSAAARSK